MSDNVKKLFNLVSNFPSGFYVEHNRHENMFLELPSILVALVEKGIVSQELADICAKTQNLWYARYYAHNSTMYESYGSTFEYVVDEIMKRINEDPAVAH